MLETVNGDQLDVRVKIITTSAEGENATSCRSRRRDALAPD
jgi:hypothetical protein